MPITLTHFLVLSAVSFSVGLYGALSKRNVVAVLMCIELMFNAVNISLVAFARYTPATAVNDWSPLTRQIFALFIITVAAAEAAVALAIILAIYRTRHSVNIDEIDLLKS